MDILYCPLYCHVRDLTKRNRWKRRTCLWNNIENLISFFIDSFYSKEIQPIWYVKCDQDGKIQMEIIMCQVIYICIYLHKYNFRKHKIVYGIRKHWHRVLVFSKLDKRFSHRNHHLCQTATPPHHRKKTLKLHTLPNILRKNEN